MDQLVRDGQRQQNLRPRVCDAVEADELGYQIDGVQVSDFITPAWYEPTSADRLDFKKHVSKELELAPGGYISIFDSTSGWTQINARGATEVREWWRAAAASAES